MNDTKNNILKSSKELFSKYEYKKVSMDEIAKNANLTKKTIYSYFKDKETLVTELVDIEVKNMMDKVNTYSSNNNFFDFINNTLSYFLKCRRDNKFLVNISKESNKLSNIKIKIDNMIINFIKEKLLLLKKENINLNFDVDLSAFIIYKIYIAIMFEWTEEINEEELTLNIMKILKNGLFD